MRQRLVSETSRLVVLVADLRSVVRVRALLDRFQEREKAGQNPAPHFLLNQFDSSAPLHRDLRASLAELLGERLLPFTLRRTDEAALSLAEGVTIVDYAPGSGLAEDFQRLADWINLWQPARPELYQESYRASAAAGGSR
jgi:cellulose biosynthesis protein BcsQ